MITLILKTICARTLALVAVVALLGCGPTQQQTEIALATDLATTPAPLNESWAVEWWLPRHKEKLAAKNPNIDVVLIGDSITHGWENQGKVVWERYFKGVDVLNLGFSGDRTENVLWRLDHGEVDGLNPGLIVIMIGTNNTGHRMDHPEAITAGVRKILAELDAKLPDAAILLLAILPRGESPDDPMRVNNEKTNRLLLELAAEAGVHYGDFNAAFLTDSGTLALDIMPDFLHPNETGYEIWAQQLQPWLRSY